jgi:hypothetical protein
LIRAYEAGVIGADELPPGVLGLDKQFSEYTLRKGKQ